MAAYLLSRMEDWASEPIHILGRLAGYPISTPGFFDSLCGGSGFYEAQGAVPAPSGDQIGRKGKYPLGRGT